MEKRRLGDLDAVMSKVWEYYVYQGASNTSTRRHLKKMEAFSKTQIFRLMEKLQIAKSEKEKKNGVKGKKGREKMQGRTHLFWLWKTQED